MAIPLRDLYDGGSAHTMSGGASLPIRTMESPANGPYLVFKFGGEWPFRLNLLLSVDRD